MIVFQFQQKFMITNLALRCMDTGQFQVEVSTQTPAFRGLPWARPRAKWSCFDVPKPILETSWWSISTISTLSLFLLFNRLILPSFIHLIAYSFHAFIISQFDLCTFSYVHDFIFGWFNSSSFNAGLIEFLHLEIICFLHDLNSNTVHRKAG
jgi:hypothetical protein